MSTLPPRRAPWLPIAVAALLAACGGPPPVCSPACAPGYTCKAGTCTPGGETVDAAGPDLAMGKCVPACAGARPFCNGSNKCVPCLGDGDCPVGSQCKTQNDGSIACVPGCADDSRCRGAGGGTRSCCAGRCADTTSDVVNCGGCGVACAIPHAVASCVASTCHNGGCNIGYGDCNGDPKDGCEANLRVDIANCGACGVACSFPNAVSACAALESVDGGVPDGGAAPGCYLAACGYGFEDCDQDPANGCEVSTLTDVNNCGGCGTRCSAMNHARVVCANARCAVSGCDAGYLDCDGNGANGCEVVGATDKANCGACGNACGPGLVCAGGQCTCAMCSYPNASATCVNNLCVFGKCNAGFFDCNNNIADGCEANLAFDNKNCGGCNVACPLGQGCVGGMCVVSTCLNNPQWQRVTCTTQSWVWSRDRAKAPTVQAAAGLHVLATGCKHGSPQPDLGDGVCSLDGKGWVSTMTFVMAGCDASWYHLGGSYTGNCGGHDGDVWRHLVLGDNDCFPY